MVRWCSLFFLFLAIHGCMANGFLQNCQTTQRCANQQLRREMDRINWVPTTETHLNTLCPSVMPALRCAVQNIQECVGRDLVALAASNSNRTAAGFAHGVVTARDVITDLCTQGSELRRNYLSGISCVRNLATDPEVTMKCQQQGLDASAAYQRAKALLGNEISTEDRESEHECMTKAYALGCFAEKIHQTCGETARKTFVDIIKRFQYLRREACFDVNINNLKTGFLDHLQLEGQRRSIFSSVFEARRRK